MNAAPYEIVKLGGDAWTPSPAQALHDATRAKVVFIGGLDHVEGRKMTPVLNTALQGATDAGPGSRSGVEIYGVQVPEPMGWEAKVLEIAAFEHHKTVGPAARAFAEEILAPDMVVTGEPKTDRAARLARHLSTMTLIGYSYGTNFLQQADMALREKLSSNDWSPAEIDEGLSRGFAVAHGPVGTPSRDANALPQVVHAHRRDRMTRELSRIDLGPPPGDQRCLSHHRQGASLVLIPEHETSEINTIKWRQRAGHDGGETTEAIARVKNHEEAHHLLMYLNTTRSLLSPRMTTVESLPTAPVAEAATRGAVQQSISAAANGTARNGRALLRDIEASHLNPRAVEAMGGLFYDSMSLIWRNPEIADIDRSEERSLWNPPQPIREALKTGTAPATYRPSAGRLA